MGVGEGIGIEVWKYTYIVSLACIFFLQASLYLFIVIAFVCSLFCCRRYCGMIKWGENRCLFPIQFHIQTFALNNCRCNNRCRNNFCCKHVNRKYCEEDSDLHGTEHFDI